MPTCTYECMKSCVFSRSFEKQFNFIPSFYLYSFSILCGPISIYLTLSLLSTPSLECLLVSVAMSLLFKMECFGFQEIVTFNSFFMQIEPLYWSHGIETQNYYLHPVNIISTFNNFLFGSKNYRLKMTLYMWGILYYIYSCSYDHII